jgi:hypothetical protein
MSPWKKVGWIAMILLVAGGTAWRISTCGCYPPHNSAAWTSVLLKAGMGLLVCGLITWDFLLALKSQRVPR